MDEVFAALENNDLNYYVLDGQMSILEDYLALFPEKEALVRKFVSQKRLFIGPWYTQIDEMVTSGESILRNLRTGMEDRKSVGEGKGRKNWGRTRGEWYRYKRGAKTAR